MKHLEKNNETYVSHFLFAVKVGMSLIFRGTLFIIHAFLPICEIPKKWNLENTLVKIYKWNVYSNRRLQK